MYIATSASSLNDLIRTVRGDPITWSEMQILLRRYDDWLVSLFHIYLMFTFSFLRYIYHIYLHNNNQMYCIFMNKKYSHRPFCNKWKLCTLQCFVIYLYSIRAGDGLHYKRSNKDKDQQQQQFSFASIVHSLPPSISIEQESAGNGPEF